MKVESTVFQVFSRPQRKNYFEVVNLDGMKRAFSATYRDLLRHHTFQVSAALSYYFVLSVFPALIFLSAIVGFISLPDLFNHVLLLMGRLLPPDTMKLVYSVLGDVLASHRGTWLVFRNAGINLDGIRGLRLHD